MREGGNRTLDLDLLRKLADRLSSDAEGERLSGLQAVMQMFAEKGATIQEALVFAGGHMDMWSVGVAAPVLAAAVLSGGGPAETGAGIPDCRPEGASSLRVFRPGGQESEVFVITGVKVSDMGGLCLHLKDALVAGVLHKTPFKLKLADIRDDKGRVVETALQAEYGKEGSAPIRIWSGNRGDAGVLATVLRKAAAWALPGLAG